MRLLAAGSQASTPAARMSACSAAIPSQSPRVRYAPISTMAVKLFPTKPGTRARTASYTPSASARSSTLPLSTQPALTRLLSGAASAAVPSTTQ